MNPGNLSGREGGEDKSAQRNLGSQSMAQTKLKSFGCGICGKTFSKKSHRNEHSYIHSGIKFGCETCGKTFTQKKDLYKHSLIHLSLECEMCGKVFNKRNDLKQHSLIHSGIRPFECETCGKTFRLKAHLKSHHATHRAEKNFRCEKCEMTFNHKSGLSTHSLTHTGRPRCEKCGMTFYNNTGLKRHSLTHTFISCETCGKTFRSRKKLEKHKLSHEKVKGFESEMNGQSHKNKLEQQSATRTTSFMCTLCDESFVTQDDVDAHLTTHEVMGFESEMDGQTCANKNELEQQSATRTTSFMCTLCDESFVTQDDVDSHFTTHEVKGFESKMDEQTCAHKSELEQSATRTTSFKCTHCNESFVTQDDVDAHLTTFHAQVKAEPIDYFDDVKNELIDYCGLASQNEEIGMDFVVSAIKQEDNSFK